MEKHVVKCIQYQMIAGKKLDAKIPAPVQFAVMIGTLVILTYLIQH